MHINTDPGSVDGLRVNPDGFGFLLADVARLMRRRFRAGMASEPLCPALTPAQSRALTWIWRHEGAHQRAIADLLDIQPMTLARLVDQLAELGLVERRPDPADRRAWRLYLTGSASPRLHAIRRTGASTRSTALRGFEPDEAEQLMAMLHRVRANLADDIDHDHDTGEDDRS